MSDNLAKIDAIDFRRVFPWIYLFRAFKIAAGARTVVLASIGVLALSVGNWGISFLPFAEPAPAEWPWQTELFGGAGQTGGTPLKDAGALLTDPLGSLLRIAGNWPIVLSPLRTLLEPAILLFQPDNTWAEVGTAWTRLLWGLLVLAIFGGAITRMAAVQFARDEKLSMRAALKFSTNRLFSYFSAPLLPICGVGMLWLVCLVGGWIGCIPTAGSAIVAGLWFVALLCGFVMTLMLIGAAVGWPLMYAGISAEGSDGFDGLSRSYSYVFDRPWYYLWLAVLAMAYGSVVIFFVCLFTCLTVYLSGWAVASSMGSAEVDGLLQATPQLLGGEGLLASGGESQPPIGVVVAVAMWLQLVAVLLVGFVHSYFWSAGTIIYFLLRQSDDGVDLDQVYYEEQELDDLASLAPATEFEQTEPAQQDRTAAEDTGSDEETPTSNENASEGPEPQDG